MISLDLRLGVEINEVTLKRRRGAISVGIKHCRIEKKSSFEKLDLIFTLFKQNRHKSNLRYMYCLLPGLSPIVITTGRF